MECGLSGGGGDVEGVEEVEGGVLEEVEHKLKAFGALIIRVGHMVIAGGESEKVGHRHDF